MIETENGSVVAGAWETGQVDDRWGNLLGDETVL